MIASKLKTIEWFVKRPQYLQHAAYIVYSKFLKNNEKYRPESTKWANSNALDLTNALQLLNVDYTPGVFETHFSQVRKFAQHQVNNCPVNMGGEGCLELLSVLAENTHSGHIIETGVAYGWSSLAILHTIKSNQNRFLYSIDLPYIQGENDQWVGCVVPDAYRAQWKLFKGSDRMRLGRVLDEIGNNLAMVHYDSDKSYHGRVWAYPKLWNAIVSGGFFISDDIQDNFAFREFTDQLNLPFVIIEHLGKYVGIIRKP